MANITPENLSHPQLLDAYKELQKAYAKLQIEQLETLKHSTALSISVLELKTEIAALKAEK